MTRDLLQEKADREARWWVAYHAQKAREEAAILAKQESDAAAEEARQAEERAQLLREAEEAERVAESLAAERKAFLYTDSALL